MRNWRLTRIGRLVAIAVALVTPLTATGPVEAAEVSITMVDDGFMPPTITIQPGDRVTWLNRGAHGHTITSDTGLWDSGTVAGIGTYRGSGYGGGSYGGGGYGSGTTVSGSSIGQAYWVQFHRVGTYNYYCRFHAAQGMRGTVIVGQPQTAVSSSSPAVQPPLFYPFRPRAARD